MSPDIRRRVDATRAARLAREAEMKKQVAAQVRTFKLKHKSLKDFFASVHLPSAFTLSLSICTRFRSMFFFLSVHGGSCPCATQNTFLSGLPSFFVPDTSLRRYLDVSVPPDEEPPPSLPFSVLSHTEREEPCSRWVLDRRITRATGLIKSPCCPFIYLLLSSVLDLPLTYLPIRHILTDLPHLPSDRRQTAQTRSPRNPSGLIDHNSQNRIPDTRTQDNGPREGCLMMCYDQAPVSNPSIHHLTP